MEEVGGEFCEIGGSGGGGGGVKFGNVGGGEFWGRLGGNLGELTGHWEDI